MKRVFTSMLVLFTSVFLHAATFRNYVAHSISGSTYTIWVNSDTQFGESVIGQICQNGGSPFTGFVTGTFDNSSVAGANWKIVITLNGQTTPRLELANLNQSSVGYGYTGCNINMSIVLPVELSDFNVQKINNSVKLGWLSSFEAGNTHFNIQRSANNQTWQTIGSVKATNNPSGAKYNFVDEAALSTINYYRLEMVDYDGKMTYSKVVAVSVEGSKKSLAVFPNPVKSELNLVSDGNTEGVSIFDMTGRAVRQYNDNRSKVNVTDLPNGVYFVRLMDKNGLASAPVRFVKQ